MVSGYLTTVYIGNYYEYIVDSTPPPTPTPIPSPTLSPTPVGIPTVDPTGGSEGVQGTSPSLPTITTRSYYYAGAQRLAVRDSATGVAYLYSDHLGSASVAVSISGSVLSRTRYKPWGEQRGQSGAAFPTDRLFTGQIWDGAESSGGTGLYFYYEVSPWGQRALLQPGAGQVHAGRYHRARAGDADGVRPVCLYAEQPGQVYGSEWTLHG